MYLENVILNSQDGNEGRGDLLKTLVKRLYRIANPSISVICLCLRNA